VEPDQHQTKRRRLALQVQGVRQAHGSPRVMRDKTERDLEVFHGRPNPSPGELRQA
jgi:hypothetical protein